MNINSGYLDTSNNGLHDKMRNHLVVFAKSLGTLDTIFCALQLLSVDLLHYQFSLRDCKHRQTIFEIFLIVSFRKG